ncbi:hypothetical protein A4R43_09405 [Amycolatopsis albispora]|uniref:Uncharacterized protein n=1 Tax=Amycolatopsis albispora TaxID=1804986 RepID=A0A344L3U4_9PSEU|nr:hypothetical protein A4R43_09405 [Amycolatopsis albispora]
MAAAVAAAGILTAAPASASGPELRPGFVSPPVLTGGDGAVQTIVLSAPAPPGGTHVSLYGDLVYGHSTGRHAYVPAGATTVSFPFRTAAPATDVVRTLHAQVSGAPLVPVAEVTIRPADPATRAVTSLSYTKESLVVGETTQGTVTLAQPAPAGGLAVSLWSNTHYGPGVHVPPYVVVPEGSTTATFPLKATRAETPAVVSPSADLGTSRASRDVVVVPDRFALSDGLLLKPGTVTPGAIGIGRAPNPEGTTVRLHTDFPGVTVPSTVHIPPGSPGIAIPLTAAPSIPRGSQGTLTATWNGTTATTTFITG